MLEKWFRYFKHVFIWLQLKFGKNLGSFICTAKKFEWLGILRAAENKDVSWNSAFSEWASTESTEKIHRNRAKEKMSITHGQLPHNTKTEKDNATKSTEQCQSCGISLCRDHSMRVCHGCLQWNFILYFIFIELIFSFIL